jgi:hypothetical protein
MWQFAFKDKTFKFFAITPLNISFSYDHYLGSTRQAPKYISQLYHVRFDILIIVNVKTMISCNMTLCSLIHMYNSHVCAVLMYPSTLKMEATAYSETLVLIY